MKLQKKIMLSFMAVILCMMSLLLVYINTVLVERVKEEKLLNYRVGLKQLTVSTELMTKEIEQGLFNQYFASSLLAKLSPENSPGQNRQGIESDLLSIPLNNANITSVCLLDNEGNEYFASPQLDDHKDAYADILTMPLEEAFTLWLRDPDQNLFLKKDVMQTFPLKHLGTIVAKLNKPKLLAAIGLDMVSDGMMAIVTEQKRVLAANDEAAIAMLEAVISDETLHYLPVQRFLKLEGKEYLLLTQPGKNRAWYAVQLVPVDVMLTMPRELSNTIRTASIAFMLVSLLIAYAITHTLTRNVKNLLKSFDEVGGGNFESNLTVTSRDEIGELARQFQTMQNRLKTTTVQMIEKATEKQQAEYEMLELKYRSLQTQVSPHLICNILSSIDALAIMGHSEEVSKLAVEASRYLRCNLHNADNKFTLLALEMRFVEEYATLYSDIYHLPFTLETVMEDESADCEVPTMLLQPLVENALLHGFLPDEAERTFHIRIEARFENDRLVICIADDGKGFGEEMIKAIERAEADYQFNKKLPGFGLRSVLQRLRLLYGDQQSLQIESLPDVRTTITIRIPKRYHYEEDKNI